MNKTSDFLKYYVLAGDERAFLSVKKAAEIITVEDVINIFTTCNNFAYGTISETAAILNLAKYEKIFAKILN